VSEPMKTKGRAELSSLKKRAIRQYGAQMIDRPTYDKLVKMIDELDAFIIVMPEKMPARLRKRTI
jgi:hypothetical protein